MRSHGYQASSHILFKKQLNRETGLKHKFSIAAIGNAGLHILFTQGSYGC